MSVGARVQRGVVVLEPRADVVGAQDRGLGRGLQALRAHHAAVHPADRQHGRVAQRRRRHGTHAMARHARGRMARQVGHEVLDHADRAHARAAAAVRDAEGLVQVQVAHVAAELARRGHAHQRIHVGAVDIHATAVRVHQLAQLLHAGLEHAVRARVGDHHRGQVPAVLLAGALQVVEVDVALRVAGRHHHLQAHHLRARGIGAVRRRGDQADVAVAFALRFVEGANRQQAGVLALRAGIGLQADARVAGGFAEPGAQLGVELGIALQLLGRREGMDVRELGPGDRDHLAGRVELHGAAAQRDHAAVEREVLVRQAADVAQHRGLALVGVEHRMRQEGARAAQFLRNARRGVGGQLLEARHRGAGGHEQRPQGLDVGARAGLVERDAQVLLQPLAQVHVGGLRALEDLRGVVAGADGQRIEGGLVDRLAAHLGQAAREDGGERGHALRDAREAVGPVVDRVHARDHGGQHLRGADV